MCHYVCSAQWLTPPWKHVNAGLMQSAWHSSFHAQAQAVRQQTHSCCSHTRPAACSQCQLVMTAHREQLEEVVFKDGIEHVRRSLCADLTRGEQWCTRCWIWAWWARCRFVHAQQCCCICSLRHTAIGMLGIVPLACHHACHLSCMMTGMQDHGDNVACAAVQHVRCMRCTTMEGCSSSTS